MPNSKLISYIKTLTPRTANNPTEEKQIRTELATKLKTPYSQSKLKDRDNQGMNALMHAVTNELEHVVDWLFDQNNRNMLDCFDIDTVDNISQTALCYAVGFKDSEEKLSDNQDSIRRKRNIIRKLIAEKAKLSKDVMAIASENQNLVFLQHTVPTFLSSFGNRRDELWLEQFSSLLPFIKKGGDDVFLIWKQHLHLQVRHGSYDGYRYFSLGDIDINEIPLDYFDYFKDYLSTASLIYIAKKCHQLTNTTKYTIFKEIIPILHTDKGYDRIKILKGNTFWFGGTDSIINIVNLKSDALIKAIQSMGSSIKTRSPYNESDIKRTVYNTLNKTYEEHIPAFDYHDSNDDSAMSIAIELTNDFAVEWLIEKIKLDNFINPFNEESLAYLLNRAVQFKDLDKQENSETKTKMPEEQADINDCVIMRKRRIVELLLAYSNTEIPFNKAPFEEASASGNLWFLKKMINTIKSKAKRGLNVEEFLIIALNKGNQGGDEIVEFWCSEFLNKIQPPINPEKNHGYLVTRLALRYWKYFSIFQNGLSVRDIINMITELTLHDMDAQKLHTLLQLLVKQNTKTEPSEAFHIACYNLSIDIVKMFLFNIPTIHYVLDTKILLPLISSDMNIDRLSNDDRADKNRIKILLMACSMVRQLHFPFTLTPEITTVLRQIDHQDRQDFFQIIKNDAAADAIKNWFISEQEEKSHEPPAYDDKIAAQLPLLSMPQEEKAPENSSLIRLNLFRPALANSANLDQSHLKQAKIVACFNQLKQLLFFSNNLALQEQVKRFSLIELLSTVYPLDDTQALNAYLLDLSKNEPLSESHLDIINQCAIQLEQSHFYQSDLDLQQRLVKFTMQTLIESLYGTKNAVHLLEMVTSPNSQCQKSLSLSN